jgi:SOS response regulatory protein OraA/RecX
MTLSSALLEECRRRNLNVTKLCEYAINHALKYEGVYREAIELAVLESENERFEEQMEKVKTRLAAFEKLRPELQKKLEDQRKLVEEISRSFKVADLIKSINKALVETEYDAAATFQMCSSEIETLYSLNYVVDLLWLTRQANRLKI